ncbi:MAG: hypothetical protein QOD86_588 [Miltoncostaeaceae bacterium]|nr:hypothetical protein [Miltoncostaeaceae bacterium]
MKHRPLLASLAACAVGVGAFAGAALAHHSHAEAYTAKLAAPDGGGAAGTARLLDKPGKGRDVLTVVVRGLAPRTAYLFHIHETDEPGDPCAAHEEHEHEEHAPIAGWKPGKLVSSKKGRAVATARARGFEKDADETYWVEVETPAGDVLACGVLKAR